MCACATKELVRVGDIQMENSTAIFLLESCMRMNDTTASRTVLGRIIGQRQARKGVCDKIFVDMIRDAVSSVALFEFRSPTAAPDKVLVTTRRALSHQGVSVQKLWSAEANT